MTRDELTTALEAELTQRGIEYRAPDVYGFVAGCWPTDSTPAELADDWEATDRFLDDFHRKCDEMGVGEKTY